MISVLGKSTSSHSDFNFDVKTYIFQKWTVCAAVSISGCVGAKVIYQQRDLFVTLQIQTSTNDNIGAIAFGRKPVKEAFSVFHSEAAVSQELKVVYPKHQWLAPRKSFGRLGQ